MRDLFGHLIFPAPNFILFCFVWKIAIPSNFIFLVPQ